MGASSREFMEQRINQQNEQNENDTIQYRERLFDAYFTDRRSGRGDYTTNRRTINNKRNTTSR